MVFQNYCICIVKSFSGTTEIDLQGIVHIEKHVFQIKQTNNHYKTIHHEKEN